MICLELFNSRLLDAERLLSEGPLDGSVADGQRFGNRLDLLVNLPEEAKRIITERWRRASTMAELRSDTPTLENIFVATLRQLGEEIHAVPFPHLCFVQNAIRKDPGAMVGKTGKTRSVW